LSRPDLSWRVLHQIVERFTSDRDPFHYLRVGRDIRLRQVVDRLQNAREPGVVRAKDLARSRHFVEDGLEHFGVRVLACPAAQCRLAVREGFDGYDLLRSHQKMNCPEEVALVRADVDECPGCGPLTQCSGHRSNLDASAEEAMSAALPSMPYRRRLAAYRRSRLHWTTP
jgi:hypothetical protein